jgi:hypothetical protein
MKEIIRERILKTRRLSGFMIEIALPVTGLGVRESVVLFRQRPQAF